MSKASAARKLAAAAAYGGGGLSVVGGALYGVLRAEAKMARRTIGEVTNTPPPDATGWYGRGRPGPAIRIALLGDSSAAGYGVSTVSEVPGALIASGVAARANRRVYLREFAVVGARSSDLLAQVERALPVEPAVTVILIGANDVTHTVLPGQSVQHLSEAVRRLNEAGSAVVVGTCPDLGTVQPIAPPLKQVARAWSRRLATAQTLTVLEAGGRTVSLGSILGPEFAASPTTLFGPDQFHPSVDGYRALSEVLVPTTLAALGLIEEQDAELETRRGERIMPITTAAVEAVRTPGTELDSTEVGGSARGLRGRWVALRHRRRHKHDEAESPEAQEEDDAEKASAADGVEQGTES